MVTTNIKSEIINRFISKLEEKISIEKIILFGSTANGTNTKYSDIDIAVISKDFGKMKPFSRLVFLGKTAWQAHTTEIEALGYTPREYKGATKYDFLSEIKKTGKNYIPNKNSRKP